MADAFNTPPSPHPTALSLHLWLPLYVAVPHLLVTTDQNQPTLLGMRQLTLPLATVNQLSQFRGMSLITTDPCCRTTSDN